MSKQKKKKNTQSKQSKKLTKEEQRKQDIFKTWRFIITFVVLFSSILLLMALGGKS